MRTIHASAICISTIVLASAANGAAPFQIDAISQQQADRERTLLADNSPRTQIPEIVKYRGTAERVEYPAGELSLPCWLYRPAGDGPHPAVIWNHGSEKSPLAQAELARFYTEHGFVFFEPIREGHGDAPGEYIVDLQQKLIEHEDRDKALADVVALHERFNADVVAAVAWLKTQPYVDRDRIVMSGCSYGGIQTLLSAEKGLGVRAFIPFAPGAMSWASQPLRDRLEKAAQNAKAPVFLIQAKNDYSTGPSEKLGPVLDQLGAPSTHKLYAEFGLTPQQGHGAFACWSLGTTVWGADVLQFIDAAFQKSPTAENLK